ncbi:vam6/Vps39-like protein [Planococcus citri]|uniref:vam6/Vps39-like protein n=1 Tax=Planococcus citri TaxID=170843 RepID=UPI0031F8A1B9
MHDPYEWYPILKLNSQIDAVAAYDENLLVGTKQGHLIMYSVTRKSPDQKYEVQLLRYNKNFYRKPIQQLFVIAPLNILIILVDNMIYVHDLSSMNFPLITSLPKTKGANLFTVDIKNQTDKSLTLKQSYIVRLCVAVKKKLQLFYWKNKEFLEFGEDISISDYAKSLAWCQETICVGFKAEYALIQLGEKNKQQELFSTGRNMEPNVIKLNDSTFALIKDSQSVFVETDGNLLVKNAVKWTEMPLAVAYDEPYIVALLNDSVEVRAVQPTLLVQSMKISNPQLICYCSSGVLYVSADFHVYRVQAIPVARQIKTLIDERQFQLALQLCNISDEPEAEKMKNRHQIQTLYAYDLFSSKQFTESMKQFLALDTDPYDVIRLFPNFLPQNGPPGSEDSTPSEGPPKFQNRDQEKSIMALIEYLTEARLLLMQKKKDPAERDQTLQIIDTTLLKCYLNTNDALIAPLLRLNNCHIVDTEKTLKKHKKYSELIILYETKGLHHRALELLEKQADQADSSLRGHERTVQYLQRLGKENIDLIFQFAGWVLERHPEDGLKIFTEDIQEVEQLPRPKVLDYLNRTNKSLVIPYLEHVIYIWNDTNPLLHNALVHQYREKVLQLCDPSSPAADQVAGQNIRSKMINFLETSDYYVPETVLTHFPFDYLHEERAVLLGKFGRHEKALTIYVTVLNDIEKAAHYCERVYKEGKSGSENVYIILLQLLISPPESWLVGVTPPVPPKPDIEMALTLLEGNASKIPPAKALKILPKDIPVYKINHYLNISLGQHLTDKRNKQILRGLLYAEHLQVQEQRIQFESQNMLLTEWNICSVCKKKFSNQSAFIRNPNGDVIHFSCQDTQKRLS